MKIPAFIKKIGRDLLDFVYNEDRAVASIAGAPPQETISSEIGRHDDHDNDSLADIAGAVLDAIQPNHVENAVTHANALDAADNGVEK